MKPRTTRLSATLVFLAASSRVLARATDGDVAGAGGCPADVDGNGIVGFTDLNLLLSAWGPCPACPEDLDGNGTVGFTDLNLMLAAWGTCPDLLPDLLADLVGPDPVAADAAYVALFELGGPAIEPLVQIATDVPPVPYAGAGFGDERTSIMRQGPPPVPVVAMYLVDGILLDDLTPYHLPELTGGPGTDELMLLGDAAALYGQWMSDHQGMSLDEMRLDPLPLDPSPIIWRGGPLPPVLPAPPIGIVAFGTSTPIEGGAWNPKIDTPGHVDGPDADALPDPYAFLWKPAVAGGPRPYNCLAWSLGETDRWLEPAGGHDVDDILDDYGYDEANPVGCGNACPAGKGPKVKIISQTKNGTTQAEWVHAMKQEADGDWTSKNGMSFRYDDITDCTAFLDKHYPVRNGWSRVVQCFCKE